MQEYIGLSATGDSVSKEKQRITITDSSKPVDLHAVSGANLMPASNSVKQKNANISAEYLNILRIEANSTYTKRYVGTVEVRLPKKIAKSA